MTISPPSNVRLPDGEPASVLAQGVDSLVLALYVEWFENTCFNKLAEIKQAAMDTGQPAPGILSPDGSAGPWVFTVRPHGADGYEWLLQSGQISMKVGHWSRPIQRPSVMVEIRSEALWTHGVDACVARVLSLLRSVNGVIIKSQISRVDLCADVLLPESIWHLGLMENIVTRATKEAPYFSHRQLTGFSIGKGKISARLYDKPREIAEQSKKQWMYTVWGLDQVPEGCRVIRVEFQLRREALVGFGVDDYGDLNLYLLNLWAALTQNWLRVVDDASKHKARQRPIPWWEVVQAAIPGAQLAQPLIRAQAVGGDIDQLGRQTLGHLTSLVALFRQGELIQPGETLDLASHLPLIVGLIRKAGWDDEKFTVEVKKKQAKRMRHGEKFSAARGALKALGLSLKRPPSVGRPGRLEDQGV